MIKISALDFLNIDFADVDILDRAGNVILSKDSQITQQWMLKYYFKDIFVEESFSENKVTISNLNTSQTAEQQRVSSQTCETDSSAGINQDALISQSKAAFQAASQSMSQTQSEQNFEIKPAVSSETQTEKSDAENMSISVSASIIDSNVQAEKVPPVLVEQPEQVSDKLVSSTGDSQTNEAEVKTAENQSVLPQVKEKEPEELPVPLKFNEDVSKEMEVNAEKLAKMFDFSPREIEDIKKIAHYCNISLDNFTTADIKKKDFGIRKAKLSHDMIQDKVGFSDMVKSSILSHENPYDSALFGLAKKIPYAHIVSVVSNYYTLRQLYKGDKEKTLKRMLEYGGNKFNIFVLHKFIRIMRSA